MGSHAKDKIRSARYIAAGLCGRCGKNKIAFHSKRRCSPCLKNQAERQAITRGMKPKIKKVKKKEIIRSTVRYSIISSPLYQCW